MKITVDRIHKIENGQTIKAFADIKIEESFLIKGLKVVQGKDGLFIGMPQEKGSDDKYYETIRPLSKEIREEVNSVVLEAYNK